MEFYHKHRPSKFKDVLGQDAITKSLLDLLKRKELPHSILLSGPSGTGKTTIARILASKIGCTERDISEINIADFRGIDTAREIRSRMKTVPLGGKAKTWILDEIHSTRADFQNSMLKILEDTPSHVYFMLCTTEPQKLIKTLRSRCTEIRTKSLDSDTMQILLNNVTTKEKIKISEDVRDKIIQVADGSARKALVLLHLISGITDEQSQIDAIQSSEGEKQAIELARGLMQFRPQWKDISKLIQAVDEEPESIRRLILAYVGGAALKAGDPSRFISIMEAFSGNYFDTGKAGLMWSCYQVCAKPQKYRK